MFYIGGDAVKSQSGRELASSQTMRNPSNSLATCADCGNDAYIRMDENGSEMLCAHCYAERIRSEKAPRRPERPLAPVPGARTQ